MKKEERLKMLIENKKWRMWLLEIPLGTSQELQLGSTEEMDCVAASAYWINQRSFSYGRRFKVHRDFANLKLTITPSAAINEPSNL